MLNGDFFFLYDELIELSLSIFLNLNASFLNIANPYISLFKVLLQNALFPVKILIIFWIVSFFSYYVIFFV